MKVQNKPGAVHDHIFAFKELATRLEADLSPKWTISSLKTSLLVQGTDSSERITGTIFTVYDSADHSGEENIGLDKLLSGLEKVAEEAARNAQANETQQPQRRN